MINIERYPEQGDGAAPINKFEGVALYNADIESKVRDPIPPPPLGYMSLL